MARPSLFDLLKTEKPVVGPGVWDVLSAKTAERAGFRMAFLSGYCLSATHLGEPDFGFITAAHVVDAARRICGATKLALVCDIDTGYGGAFNVERVVRELVQVGAAGCFLEDQLWPKRCGHMEGKQIVPLEDYLPKLKAALAARGDAEFHITARTDARAAVSLEEALRRARAFAEAGADAVFVEAPQSLDELRQIRAAVPQEVTVVANMVEQGKTPILHYDELAKLGFGFVAVPVAGLLATAKALEGVFGTLKKDGTTEAFRSRMLTFSEMNDLNGLPEYYRREKDLRG